MYKQTITNIELIDLVSPPTSNLYNEISENTNNSDKRR